MSTLDLSLIGIYFFVVFAIGVWVSRKIEDSSDLFLAGRSLKWPEIGLSLFASNISSSTIIGLTGAAYSVGIAIANYEWMASLVLIFMCFFLIPVLLRSKITTLTELLEIRFDRTARLYYSFITIFLSIVVDTAGGLYAGALVIGIFFPDISTLTITFSLAGFAGLYTAMGGLKAVVYTDTIQAVLLLIGSFILTFMVVHHVDVPISEMSSLFPEGHFSLIRPIDDANMPWLGTLIGLPVLGYWYWGTNQYITQRLLAAESVHQARLGALLGAGLKLIPLFSIVIPGALAILIFPNLEHPDSVYPKLISEFLPSGLKGLLVAGLIAAIMSSVDSTLNSASTLVLHDFVVSDKKALPQKTQVWLGRGVTVLLMTVAALWAPVISQLGGLYAYLQQSFAILVPPVAVIYLMGTLTTWGRGPIATRTLIFGHGLGILAAVLRHFDWLNLHFTITCGIVTAACALFYVTLALLSGPQKSADAFALRDQLGFIRGSEKEESDLYKWPAFALLLVIGIMVFVFW